VNRGCVCFASDGEANGETDSEWCGYRDEERKEKEKVLEKSGKKMEKSSKVCFLNLYFTFSFSLLSNFSPCRFRSFHMHIHTYISVSNTIAPRLMFPASFTP